MQIADGHRVQRNSFYKKNKLKIFKKILQKFLLDPLGENTPINHYFIIYFLYFIFFLFSFFHIITLWRGSMRGWGPGVGWNLENSPDGKFFRKK